MKKLLAGLVALTFLAVSGLAAAQDKKQETKDEKKEMKKDTKGDKAAASKADKTAKAPKKKKEGC